MDRLCLHQLPKKPIRTWWIQPKHRWLGSAKESDTFNCIDEWTMMILTSPPICLSLDRNRLRRRHATHSACLDLPVVHSTAFAPAHDPACCCWNPAHQDGRSQDQHDYADLALARVDATQIRRVCTHQRRNLSVNIALYYYVNTVLDYYAIYFRKRVLGNIFTLDNRYDPPHERELAGTADAAQLVALALSPSRLYWSDHRSIRSANAVDGTDVRTDLASLVRVRWTGVNFGASRDDLVELSVLGTPCVSVATWSPTFVECVVATRTEPSEDDCVVRTRSGDMRGVAQNRFEEMQASGVPSPIVGSLQIDVTAVAPQALAIDSDDALFWANAVDGVIYRSSLHDSAIDVIQRNVWDVKGMSLLRWPSVDGHDTSLELLYSLEGKGLVQRTRVERGVENSPQTVLSGLRSPRGLALDPQQQFVYFTEKTGRIYRASCRAWQPLPSEDPSVTPLPAPQLLVTLSSLTRLGGLAVDDAFVYWCESNSNVVARAPLDAFTREVLVGGSADSALSWPRSIVLKSLDGAQNAANGDFYYVEYTGRITKGRSHVLVNELRVSAMKNLDQQIQQRDAQTQTYALE